MSQLVQRKVDKTTTPMEDAYMYGHVQQHQSPTRPALAESQTHTHTETPIVKERLQKKTSPINKLQHRNAYFNQYMSLLFERRLYYALIWTCISLLICFILFADLMKNCEATMPLCTKNIKCLCALGFLASALLSAAYYLFYKFCYNFSSGNQVQKRLLGFSNYCNTNDKPALDKSMNVSSAENELLRDKEKPSFCMCTICKNMNTNTPKTKIKNFLKCTWSPKAATSPTMTSPPAAKSASLRNSPHSFNSSLNKQQQQQNVSHNVLPKSPNTSSANNSYNSPYSSAAKGNFITDKETLREFLRNVRVNENDYLDDSNDSKYSNSSLLNKSHAFEPPVYQFAPLPETQPTLPENDSNSITKVERQSHLIKGIHQDRLVQYIANLRRWLSKTIIERLCVEFDKANEIFKNCGLADIQIGITNIERLRKISLDKEFVTRFMPNLPLLYRFLNLCPNQAYLVQRIKELSTGSCMAEYTWKISNMQLPSDAAILFHLFCVYMDSQLNPMPQGCSERPFHSQYVIVDDGKRPPKELIASVKNRPQCAIVCSGVFSPKFRFICNGEIQSCAPGANNLFHVILYFLLYLRTNNITSLEGVSLGKQGINISCIIDNKE